MSMTLWNNTLTQIFTMVVNSIDFPTCVGDNIVNLEVFLVTPLMVNQNILNQSSILITDITTILCSRFTRLNHETSNTVKGKLDYILTPHFTHILRPQPPGRWLINFACLCHVCVSFDTCTLNGYKVENVIRFERCFR